jgi:hypothetical protein
MNGESGELNFDRSGGCVTMHTELVEIADDWLTETEDTAFVNPGSESSPSEPPLSLRYPYRVQLCPSTVAPVPLEPTNPSQRRPASRYSIPSLAFLTCALLGLAQSLSGSIIVSDLLLAPLAIIFLGFTFVAAIKHTMTTAAESTSMDEMPSERLARPPFEYGMGLLACGILGLAQSLSDTVLVLPIILIPLATILLGFTIVGLVSFANRR